VKLYIFITVEIYDFITVRNMLSALLSCWPCWNMKHFLCSGRHFVWGQHFCDLRRDFYSSCPFSCSCCRREKIFQGEIAAATDWNRYTGGHSFGCLGRKVALCVPQQSSEFSLFSI